MRLLVLSVIVAAAAASPMPYDEACAWGPSYWCSHVKRAVDCGAFQHCLTTVWKNQVITEKSTDTTCTYCELIVTAMKDALQNHQTQELIAKEAAEMCSILPNPDWQDQCAGIVEQYTPQLIQMLENKISTDMICATLDLCPGLEDTYSPYGKDEVKVTDTQVQVEVSSECDDCTKFFQDVQKSITSNETLAQLEELLNQTLCMELGSLAGLCNQFIQEYLPLGLEMLADQIDPNIVCRVFGFCTTEGSIAPVIPLKNIFKARSQSTPLQYRSSEECDICKDLMVQIDNELRDRTVQEKVKELLENNFCEVLGTFSAQCKQLVEEYSPMLFELLVNELDPPTVCETLGVCPTPTRAKTVVLNNVITPIIKERPDQGWGYVAESEECTFCKFVFTEIDQLLKDNATLNTIEDLLEKVCAKLTTDQLTKQCDNFVKMYGEKVIALLADVMDPTELCTKVGICTAMVPKEEVAKVTDAKCQICVLVLTEVEVMLQNVSMDEIMGLLNMVCGYFPGNYSATCVKYVKEYAPLVINLLKSKEDPKTLCMMGKLCTAQLSSATKMTVPIPETLPVKAGPSIACEICDTAVFFVKELVEENATQAEIEAKLKELCDELPSGFKAECDALVGTYGQSIIQFLLNKTDPLTICTEIGLCTSGLVGVAPALQGILSPVDMLPIAPGNSQKDDAENAEICDACKLAFTYLVNTLGENKTEEKIKEELEKVCSYMPSTITGECTDLVNEYYQVIINLILLNADPEEICKTIKLCPAARVKNLPAPVHVKLLKEKTVAKDKVSASIGCVVCEFVIKELDDLLKDNRSQAAVEAALDKVCDVLPSTISDECVSFVGQYGKLVISLLVKEVNPEIICTYIGVCTAELDGMIADVHMTVAKDTVSASIGCVICEFVIKELDDLLKDNRSQAAVEAALDKVCDVLPSTISDECVSFVGQYGKLVISLLVKEVNPEIICTFIGVCTAELDGMIADVHMAASKTPAQVSDSKTCIVCKLVMKEVDQMLAGNKSKEVIFDALDRVCGLMPDTISEECEQFVTAYAPEILNLLIKSIQPKDVCAELGFCTAQKTVDTPPILKKASEVRTFECRVCDLSLIQLQRVIKMDASQMEVRTGLRKVCSDLPEDYKTQCWALVHMYGSKMVDLYQNGIDPFTSCSYIGVCEPNQGSDPLPASVVAKEDAAGKCLLCESVVKFAKKYLKKNSTVAEIELELKGLCDVLPDTVTAQCEDYIMKNIPVIVKKLEEKLSEGEICKELQMCDAESEAAVRKHDQDKEAMAYKTKPETSPKQSDDKLYFQKQKTRPLVGVKECTYGPSYWCANEENARKCGAMEHCRQHVWN